MSVIKSLSKYGLAIPVGLGNLVTKGIEKITGKEYGRTTIDEAASTTFGKVLGTSILATGAALAVAVNPAAAAKAVTPKTIIGKGAAVFTTAAAAASPKLTSTILETPFQLAKAGKKTGEAIEDLEQKYDELPPMGKVPLMVAGIGAAVGLPIVADKIIDLFNDKKDEIPLIDSPPPVDLAPSSLAPSSLETPKETEIFPQVNNELAQKTPATPLEETTTIAKTARKKRKKARLEPHRQTISQRVNVNVGVNSGNKKYIKNTILIPA